MTYKGSLRRSYGHYGYGAVTLSASVVNSIVRLFLSKQECGILKTFAFGLSLLSLAKYVGVSACAVKGNEPYLCVLLVEQ